MTVKQSTPATSVGERICFLSQSQNPLAGMSRMFQRCGELLLLLLLSQVAYSQTADFPANKFGKAAAITPSAAWTYYQGQGVASPAPSSAPRDQRIKNLARALRYDIDNIYDFVHDNVEYDPLFGLKKGAYGAIVDKSGTAFDQAHLMVELLRESDAANGTNYNPAYIYGTLSLTGTELAEWLGINGLSADAARKIFADGGIPVNVGGSTGAVSSIEIGHVWVRASVGGNTYQFDPAFVQHTIIVGAMHDGTLNIEAAMGYSASAFLASATSGSTVTANSINHVNETNIDNNLKTYSTNLANKLKTDHFADALEDIIGGKDVIRTTGQAVRDTANSNVGTTYATWSGDIPFSFRTSVNIVIASGQFSNIDEDFYSEELSGRRVAITHDVVIHNPTFSYKPGGSGRVRLQVDEVEVANGGTMSSQAMWNNPNFTTTISVDHPYAANSGSYMDASTDSYGSMNSFTAIIVGFGQVSAGYANEIDRFVPSDDKVRRYFVDVNGDGQVDGCSISFNPCVRDQLAGSASYKSKLNLGASWMAQASRAMWIQARLREGITQHHHSIGVVASAVDTWDNNSIKSETQYFDVISGWSFNSKSDSATDQSQYYYALGNTLSSLEASVSKQQSELPDAMSTNATLRWTSENTKSGGYSGVQGHLIYLATPTNWTVVRAALIAKGFVTGQIDDIEAYINDGLSVVVPSVTLVGPARRTWTSGSNVPYDTGSARIVFDPTNKGRIAHLLGRNSTGVIKGGGGPPSLNADQFPGPDGEFLEDQFENFAGSFDVDLQSGEITLTPPPDMTVGEGNFPYSLSFQRTYSSAIRGRDSPLGLGWRHNFDIRLNISSDSSVLLGEKSSVHAAQTLASFVVMGELTSNTPTIDRLLTNAVVGDWWGNQAFNNAVTIHRGNDSEQFAKLADGSFMPQTGSAAELTQSAEPQLVRRSDTQYPPYDSGATSHVRRQTGYQYDGITFLYTLDDLSTMQFNFQEAPDISDPQHPVVLDEGSLPNDLGKNVKHFRPQSWVFPFGVTVDFNYAGRMTSVSNNLGREIAFTGYSPMTSVSDGTGRSVQFTYHSLDQLADLHGLAGTHRMLKSSEDPLGNVTTYDIEDFPNLAAVHGEVTNPSGLPRRPLLKRVYLPSGNPTDTSTAFLTIGYDSFGRVESIADALNQTSQFFIAEGARGESVNPVNLAAGGKGSREYYDDENQTVRAENGLGYFRTTEYDGLGRAIKETMPEGDYQVSVYDNATHNRIRSIQYPKPSLGGSPITTETDYHSLFVRNPVAVRDGNCMSQPAAQRALCQTENVYDASSGLQTQLIEPQVWDENGVLVRPTSSYSYNILGQAISVVNAVGLVSNYAYDGADKTLESIVVDPSGLNLTTLFDYDNRGNLTSATDARGNTVQASYDDRRRIINLNAPLGASTEWVYDIDGRVEEIKAATGDPSAPFATTAFDYFVTGRASRVTNPEGHFTQFAYDAANRPSITTDAVGRSTQTIYDVVGQVLRVVRASGSPLQQDYQTYVYTGNGQQATVKDANGNLTTYTYDGFDRLVKTEFPDPNPINAGSSNPGDFEEYHYDANGNVVGKRTRKGDWLLNAYDAQNRDIRKLTQTGGSFISLGENCGGDASNVCYSYDEIGRQTKVRFGSGYAITHSYDNANRLVSTTDNGRTIDYAYDAVGNRVRMDYPGTDNFYVTYEYDALSRLTALKEKGSASLASYTYDAQSRRDSLILGNGRAINYDYYADSAVDKIEHLNLFGSGNHAVWDFGYNATNQVISKTVPAAFVWGAPQDKTDTYIANGLNQYDTINNQIMGYDDNGSLISDGVWSYGYDVENRLETASKTGVSANYEYDPLGRRSKKSGAGVSTEVYLNDGVEEIADYDGSNNLLRRYVHGLGVDERLVMYTGTSLSSKEYYHTDHQGSSVAMSSNSGALTDQYTYSAFGEPGAEGLTGNPFRYTGRRLDAESGLYYYRARFYSASIGRFLQTDPIGYGDNMNMYAYVGNDPGNAMDPSGLERHVITGVEKIVPGIGQEIGLQVSFDDETYEFGVSVRFSSRTGLAAGGSVSYESRPSEQLGNSASITASSDIEVGYGIVSLSSEASLTLDIPDGTLTNSPPEVPDPTFEVEVTDNIKKVGYSVGLDVGVSGEASVNVAPLEPVNAVVSAVKIFMEIRQSGGRIK